MELLVWAVCMRRYESEGVMDAWSELFGATVFSPRLEAALRASIPEHQAKLLSAGLSPGLIDMGMRRSAMLSLSG
jgi:hypothetical protein